MTRHCVWLALCVALVTTSAVGGAFLQPDDTRVADSLDVVPTRDDVNPFEELFDWGDAWGLGDEDEDVIEAFENENGPLDLSEEDADNTIDGDDDDLEAGDTDDDDEDGGADRIEGDVERPEPPRKFPGLEFHRRNPFLENVARMQQYHQPMKHMMNRALHGQMDVNPFFNVRWDMRMLAERNKWWNGPNVCKREEEEEKETEGTSSIIRHHMISTSVCDDMGSVYKCTTEVKMPYRTKKMSVIYECCPGYDRDELDGTYGCTMELPVVTLSEMLEHINATELLDAIESITMAEYLEQGNFTIFAPINGIFGDFSPIQSNEANVVVVTPGLVELAKELEETIMAHIVPNHMKTTYMEDEEILPTLSQGNNIRINIYELPTPVVTANCMRVIDGDNVASNGVVHVVDGLLKPVKDSIASLISKHPDLSMFKTVLGQTGLVAILKKEGDFTMFVPSNSAFDRMNPIDKEKLLSGQQCVTDIVRHHLVNNVICSDALSGELSVVNILNHRLNVKRNPDEKLFVDGAQVLETDVMATNGVIHIIDDLLIPEEALSLLDIVEKLDSDVFLDLVNASGLSTKITQMHNFTLFLPSAEAFQRLSEPEIQRLRASPDDLADRLLYHLIPAEASNADLGDRSTHNTLLAGQQLNVRNYKNFPLGLQSQKVVQCAGIEQTDIGVCGGVIHVINKVLEPPTGNVYEALRRNPNLSEFARLLQSTGVADVLHHRRVYTVFAPTNKALGSLGSEIMKYLGEHPDRLKALLQHHIADDPVCCSGMFDDILSETRATLDGSVVLTGRRGDQPIVNQVPIAKCDVMANNGIVHVIERVLPESINKYVTRHMRHRTNMDWHMHHSGDSFGRGLEDYVMNILDEWFGPKGRRNHGNAPHTDIMTQFQIQKDRSDRKEHGRGRRPGTVLRRGHNPQRAKQVQIKERLVEQRRRQQSTNTKLSSMRVEPNRIRG